MTHIRLCSLILGSITLATAGPALAFTCGDVVDNKCVVKPADVAAERTYAVACMKDKASCTRSSADGADFHKLATACGISPAITFDNQMIREGLWHQFEPMTEADAIAAALIKRCTSNEAGPFKARLKKLKRIDLKSRPAKGDSDNGAPTYAFAKAGGVLTMKVPPNSRVNPDNDGGDGDLVAWLTQNL